MKFPDYSNDELMEIARKMVKDKEYEISKEAEWKLRDYIQRQRYENPHHFSNGRLIRNLIEKAVRKQAIRILYGGNYDRQSLLTLKSEDFLSDYEEDKV
ncbi:MAG: hypothetical protein LRY71_15715 [Bacillaceae bacterium]|nr:hypothetical protein [Bacillaceae bacterium]